MAKVSVLMLLTWAFALLQELKSVELSKVLNRPGMRDIEEWRSNWILRQRSRSFLISLSQFLINMLWRSLSFGIGWTEIGL
ncbi:hypothetical protein LINPERHAP1_LOCUS37964 [Linum perenne]